MFKEINEQLILEDLQLEELKRQQEMFAPALGLQKVATVQGIGDLFSSPYLQDSLVAAMDVFPPTKKERDFVASKVEAGMVVPAFMSKNMLGAAFFKVYAEPNKRGVLGLHMNGGPHAGNIYVLMDARLQWTLFVNSLDVCHTVTHEFVHRMAKHYNTNFYSTWKKEIETYYDYLFKFLFKIPIKKKINVTPFVKFLTKNETKMMIPFRTMWDMIKEATFEHTELEENSYYGALHLYLDVLHSYYLDVGKFWNELEKPHYQFLGKCLNLAHRYTFGGVTRNYLHQCLLIPSESIASAVAFWGSPKYSKVFK